ncbi:MAG TPA: VCBS repeat-containing protein, partial [Verrucomicrobiae bacterium]|nr:VCBS repeat-containing protein [Verrucomicrobiae bacterium]
DHGTFTEIAAALPGVCCGSVAWGDFDNDGQLDLLLVGQTNSDPSSSICRVYRNDHGTFTDIGAGLSGYGLRAAAWGDYDGDGYLDVLLSAQDATRVYRNSHGVFTDINSSVPGTGSSAVAWGDYDNDGNLDFAMFGVWGGAQVYHNFGDRTAGNPFVPSAPSALSSFVLNNGALLTWSGGADPRTPTPGLTYNVRVGSTPGGMEIMAAQSDPVTGQRRLPQMGNAWERRFTALTNLPVGIYYWSVQTINNSFAGSAWAPEEIFLVTNGPPVVTTTPATSVLCCSGTLNGTVIPGGLETRAWFEWGTSTNLGNYTPMLGLGTGHLPVLVKQSLIGLQPLTPCFFRLAASNSVSAVFGSIQSFVTEEPAPLASTLGSSNIANTSAILLGTAPLNNPSADYFMEWGATPQYGHSAPASILNPGVAFDGLAGLAGIGWGKFPALSNTFTVELWAKPNLARAMTPESVDGGAGFGGQQYAIFPDQGAIAYGASTQAGVGLSIGTNGVSVVEHSDWYMPTVLVQTGTLS